MEISQIELFALFLYSSAGGLALGVIYEVARGIRILLTAVLAPGEVQPVRVFGKELSLRRRRETKRAGAGSLLKVALNITVIVIDVLFMTAAAVLVILTCYAFNSGRLRWMIYAGFAVGLFLYSVTLGLIVKGLIRASVIISANIVTALTKRLELVY